MVVIVPLGNLELERDLEFQRREWCAQHVGKVVKVLVLLVADGQLLKDRMYQARVDERDILQAARGTQSVETFEQIKYVVPERNGSISIVPRQAA